MRKTAGRSRETCRVISVANQKGGVGKTTTAINLGAALSELGQQVLLIDSDPQGNASTGLGVGPEDRSSTIRDLLAGKAGVSDLAMKTRVPNLSILPCSPELSSFDVEMAENPKRATLLRDALDRNDLDKEGFSHLLIDCPPSLNLLTVNSIVASDSVLIPLQAEFFALEGLSQLIKSIREIRAGANPGLFVEGVVLTMLDRRNNLCREVERDARINLGKLVYQTTIPRNVRLSEAPSHGLPVTMYDRRSAGAVAYRNAAAELLRREGRRS